MIEMNPASLKTLQEIIAVVDEIIASNDVQKYMPDLRIISRVLKLTIGDERMHDRTQSKIKDFQLRFTELYANVQDDTLQDEKYWETCATDLFPKFKLLRGVIDGYEDLLQQVRPFIVGKRFPIGRFFTRVMDKLLSMEHRAAS